ncbi:Isoleucine--tRNA ligase [Golovinomyces cichoracearum]|uniref:Isoleucine--tRNA ligase, mitochondrial n=1 Tax=Golovinomyces cichoracearum TaxID=62708 RepID=A0A420INJ8_9PEZI|nr:Isoleucine--tRNA ligase [Golovinomyces cichoracearum]
MPLRPPQLSWSSTLRLPKSTFLARPSLADQANYLKRCSDDLYEWQSHSYKDSTPFILLDGPPYANGELHIGHALNKILKDITCRVKVQKAFNTHEETTGRRVVYVPGWDCHGLPIEIKALEQHRVDKDVNGALDPVGVRKIARDLASKTVKLQMKTFREWCIMADWDQSWKTMDKAYEIEQLKIFQNMTQNGLISRRYKPVYWSPSSQTALAEAELDYKSDHISTAAYVKFLITTIPKNLRKIIPIDGNLSAVIWTTTPWTLPANRAIAINSELEYSIVRHNSELLLIAKVRVEEVIKLLSKGEHLDIVIDSILGCDLEGAQYKNLFSASDSCPIIHADFVSADAGSGLVHIAPGHGYDDYEVCTSLGIEAVAPVNDLGCFTAESFPADPSALEGISVLQGGDAQVLKILGDRILASHKFKHKYPYDWRTKLPVIIRATEQWFADVGTIKNKAIDCLKKVKFIPKTGRARLESFVKDRNEWCISRQRAWGVPIPALYADDGTAILTNESVEHIISVIIEKGIDAWWTDAPDDPAWIAPGLKGKFRRGKDTMDVWFDSGTSWSQIKGQADIYLEGTDQHRGWFQSSLLTHSGGSGRDWPPFKALITHGFTLDQTGKKMSKSIGNVIAPSQIMDGSLLPPVKTKKGRTQTSQALGVDALRLWAASSDFTRDVMVGEAVLQSNHSTLLKLRMIIKMLLGSMHLPEKDFEITTIDHIALIHLEKVMNEVDVAYDNYEYYHAVKAIGKWVSTDLSSFYLEAMKDRLYCGNGQSVLDDIFHGLLKMLTPITPLLVEEAWCHRPHWMVVRGDPHPLYRTPSNPIISENRRLVRDPSIAEDLPWIMNASGAIKIAQEQARSQKLIGSSLESSIILELPSSAIATFNRYINELDSIFVVSSVKLGTSPKSDWKFSSNFDAPGGQGTAWVTAPKSKKCPRCWRYVSQNDSELCVRCEEVIANTLTL